MLVLAASIPFSASPAEETQELVIRVTGEDVPPAFLRLTLEPGTAADRAIRVYSEPSHTLLLLVLDRQFEKDPGYESWRQGFAADGEPLSTTVASLPHSQPRITGPPRPRGDDVIAVWIYGTWPDGTVEDRLISAGKVGTGDFSFSTHLPAAL